MRRHGWLGLTLTLCLLAAPVATRAACFDFSKKIERPLTLPGPLASMPADARGEQLEEASGEFATGIVWAAVRGRVPQSTAALVAALQTQEARKGKDADMRITAVPDPLFLARQLVHFEITPLPFVNVEWTETWAFSLVQGTASRPERVVVAYEKTSGTSHMPHMCGSILLRAQGERSTDVLMYEEVKAYRRTSTNALNGIHATLRQLQANAWAIEP